MKYVIAFLIPTVVLGVLLYIYSDKDVTEVYMSMIPMDKSFVFKKGNRYFEFDFVTGSDANSKQPYEISETQFNSFKNSILVS